MNKSHKELGFKEAIFVFEKAIGISQIIRNYYSDKNQYFITSLKTKEIYLIEFNENFSSSKILNRFDLEERVRDIVFDYKDKVYYLYLENTPLIKINF